MAPRLALARVGTCIRICAPGSRDADIPTALAAEVRSLPLQDAATRWLGFASGSLENQSAQGEAQPVIAVVTGFSQGERRTFRPLWQPPYPGSSEISEGAPEPHFTARKIFQEAICKGIY